MKKIVIVLLFFPHIIFAQNVLQILNFDFQNGELNYEDYLVYKALAIYQPEKLPSTYSNFIMDKPIKSGFLLISEIKMNWDRITPESQSCLPPIPRQRVHRNICQGSQLPLQSVQGGG